MKTVAQFRNWLESRIQEIQGIPRKALNETDLETFVGYRREAYDHAVSLGLAEAAKVASVPSDSHVIPLLQMLQTLPESRTVLTPPQVAEQLGVAPETVVTWIKNGELKAANLATSSRPRYAVTPEDVQDFLKKRQPQPPVQPKAARRVKSGYDKFS